MDARRPAFLTPFVDPEAIQFDASYSRAGLQANLAGDLRGPSVRCRYLASAGCEEDLTIAAQRRYALKLEMQVEELAELDIDLGRRSSGVADLWLDSAITQAWHAVDAETECTMTIRGGLCLLDALVFASAADYMREIVQLMTALSTVPERRAGELAAALSRFTPESRRRRLALDQPACVVRVRGADIVVTVAHRPGPDSADAGLRTTLTASRAAPSSLVIVDSALDRRHRPRQPSRSPVSIGERSYLAEGALPPGAADLVTAARPSAVVATERDVIASLTGWVADPARLEAAVELVALLASPTDVAPYR